MLIFDLLYRNYAAHRPPLLRQRMMTTCWSQAHRPRLLKLEGWWLRSQKHHPVTPPSTSQKKVLKLILWQCPQHCLKKPLSKSQWRVWVFWAWAASSFCLVPCNKRCTFLHHNLVSTDWLCCETGRDLSLLLLLFSRLLMSDSLRAHGLQHARLPFLHRLLELAQIHVHWIGIAIQPSCPLSSPSSPAFNLSQHQGLLQWVSSLNQVAKVLELQL